MQYTVDATNQSLGRLSSKIAVLLRGKNLPSYEPNRNSNAEVLVKNLKKSKFTGQKFNSKVYHHYSGYHSGIKSRKLSELWATQPNKVLRQMVYNMLPKNKMRDKVIKNLKFDA
ncbi:MAG: 50S ribosomal protein L13 [Candidatus Yanofskybacteria bacterium RIFCSPHIGHO2_02_FULL_44_12b]|uniref:50S ribosomal protein L13 n=1 Tax=Candidatus Yanofskybacteria bacterium GW2011_GWA2_44_9 TaxID=1619025 RepID=A0A0G1N9C3_9BACT|nr:MAG: 50S ribosomal protein L13 [Candidatus Yanofskybacteria bacterium GW2011_GWA2_44_9]OGN04938.1 MAG: 50S ribosomal protein L13 [Candidatus Yanofskybacteria bacterium RIFCSPHIGHO2_01_FULL_44_24]OGN16157.1 MAG: 50S ribosomal protein L13 [Candidatus Yanofskybacteria bacterium RIFCSPHIGHO2_02_FULL_44_12b]